LVIKQGWFLVFLALNSFSMPLAEVARAERRSQAEAGGGRDVAPDGWVDLVTTPLPIAVTT